MAFTGTVQKCKNCDKVVHFIDMVTAQGASYHKTCFRCSHCNGQLSMGNYSSLDGVLYCQPHYEQHCKESGSYSKKVQPSGKPNELVKQSFNSLLLLLISIILHCEFHQNLFPNLQTRTPSKLSSFFSGTQEKCRACNKTVYPLEKVTVEGEFYHKLCFRCAQGGCKLTTSSYAALDGFLYCKPHFAQLFKEKGSYSHLTKTVSGKKTGETPPPETTQEE
ncbi:LIM domain-containing protein WLIM2b-like isoform X1 [Diospyros lotus]|uniref:LIM domain-containing protein WLIM2b-like isoform X1 n=1 Tax=Diospyros lotus TaxID=55363 RepID=UPI002254E97A|nr:LIM domain-containing protein WLIM2b-like isoform X1 [Diospyros lotus]